MNILKTTLALLLLLLLVVPLETFAQSAGGQISRKPKTLVKKESPAKKKTPSKSTAKKPAAKKTVRSSKPIPNGAVDLGLPSGTLWADRNIGANSPEGYGDYFAWGETSPKSEYNWSTYKYCNGSYDTLTKYNNKSIYGTIDNKTILEASDDAATANWGSNWRMPTHAEQEELIEKCTWTWTTHNGVKGYKVTGPNGNSIFLPAAGYRSGSSVGNAFSYGNYWSASLDESGPNEARIMDFFSANHYSYNNSRSYGYSVRAVAR